jgi:hypothetical protein
MGSDDGQTWNELGRSAGVIPPPPPPSFFGPTGSPVTLSISLMQPSRNRIHRVLLESSGEGSWLVNEVGFFLNNQPVEAGGPYRFSSAWMSEGKAEEWIYVDLGARCTFDRIALYWTRRAAEAVLQASHDSLNWKDLMTLPPATGPNDDLKLQRPARARYVRVLMKRPAAPEGYILSELEVYGRGGPVPKPAAKPALLPRADGGLDLAGCAWRLQRDSLVDADGLTLSRAGFKDNDWLRATVPATGIFRRQTCGTANGSTTSLSDIIAT